MVCTFKARGENIELAGRRLRFRCLSQLWFWADHLSFLQVKISHLKATASLQLCDLHSVYIKTYLFVNLSMIYDFLPVILFSMPVLGKIMQEVKFNFEYPFSIFKTFPPILVSPCLPALLNSRLNGFNTSNSP